MKETLEYIIETVAPIFNKKGYTATSLSEITKATNLTKGAVYFYFKNKEDLAVKAFHYNVEKIMKPLRSKINSKNTSIEKLHAFTEYMSNEYFTSVQEIGGCPMLNLGVDTQFNNKVLFDESQRLSGVLIKNISGIIRHGIQKKEIRETANPDELSMTIYAMIEGGIFMAVTHQNGHYLKLVTDHINQNIITPIQV